MSREVIQVKYEASVSNIPDPLEAIQTEAASGKYEYFLAYALDGVIWGKVENNQLILDADVLPGKHPGLNAARLSEARLFGPNTEYFIWSDGGCWCARVIQDGVGKDAEAYTDSLILWGTDEDGQAAGCFTPVREADMGIRHAPPLAWQNRHQMRLEIKNYVDYDDAGVIYVKFSRLVKVLNAARQPSGGEA